MEDFEGHTVYARYRWFGVGPESLGYPLRVSGFIDGGAGEYQGEQCCFGTNKTNSSDFIKAMFSIMLEELLLLT